MATERLPYKHDEKDVLSTTDNDNSTGNSKTKADSLTPNGNLVPPYEGEENLRRESVILATTEDLTTQVIGLEDDPTLNPWTFRTFFLGTYNLKLHNSSRYQYFNLQLGGNVHLQRKY
jgi:hypothetical protein